MKIGILAIGTRGDVQPCVALAKKLILEKCDVLFFAYSNYKDLVESNGINFIAIPGDPSKNWEDNETKSPKINIWDELDKMAKIWIDISLDKLKNVDAILYTPLCFIGSSIAEKLKVPFFPIIFEPSILSKYFISPYSPFKNSKFKFLNKLSFFISDQSFWQPMRKRINKIREEILEIEPLPFTGPYKQMRKRKIPFLCAYSNYLVPKPNDWNENITVTGYWFLENNQSYSIPEKLKKFLALNEKPILVDLGSFSHSAILPQIQMIITELSKLNFSQLIYHGKINPEKLNLPNNALLLDSSIPHSEILSSTKAVVTHGGVGVVHSAMRAGIPIIPISLFGAQLFWAKLLYNLKLGGRPIMIRKISKDIFIDSVNYVLNKSEIINNANEMSQKIKLEDGVSNAYSAIINYLNR